MLILKKQLSRLRTRPRIIGGWKAGGYHLSPGSERGHCLSLCLGNPAGNRLSPCWGSPRRERKGRQRDKELDRRTSCRLRSLAFVLLTEQQPGSSRCTAPNFAAAAAAREGAAGRRQVSARRPPPLRRPPPPGAPGGPDLATAGGGVPRQPRGRPRRLQARPPRAVKKAAQPVPPSPTG